MDYWRLISARALLGAVLVSFILASSASLRGLPAFPGAEGFGAEAKGGRGGTVYVVTNLNDSGAGSFRDAVSQPNRIVVFAVGGVIHLTTRIPVQPNITIAGQTAPGEGITIYGNGVSFSNASNTICRFIRFRQGIQGDSGTDAVGIASGSNMIFDHVSASWGRDETFSVTSSASNITLQDCIVGQGLLIHSAGGLMEPSGPVSVFRTLYADNWMRNPKVKGTHEFTNNVVYNWGSGGAYICGDSAGQSYTNIINNLFIGGVNSGTTPSFIRGNLNFHAHAAGNVQDVNPDGILAPVAAHPNDFTIVDAQPTPFTYPSVLRLLSPLEALEHVAAHAGASLHRDSVDARMVEETLSYGTLGQQIANESEVGGVGAIAGGLAPMDTDGDGMPDWWEMAADLDPLVPDSAGDADGDEYTNIENYLNAIAYAGIPGAVVLGVADDSGTLANDGNTSDNTLVLTGTAVSGSTVTLRRLGAGILGTTTAGPDGGWTFDYSSVVLEDNFYVFFASATIGGVESTLSRGFVVRVDTTAAEAPVITNLVVSPDVAFNGTAEPGVAVEVRMVGGGVVAAPTADGLGLWSAAYTGPSLAPGVYSFVASAVDVAGNAGPDSAPYTVDTSLSAPVFTGIEGDSGISSGDQITNDQTLVIRGTAPAGSTVDVSRSGVAGPVGSVAAGADGLWSLDTTETTLAAGTYTFTATATLGGNSSPASSPLVVVVDRTAPTIPSIVRFNPASAATSSSTLVFRVTWIEPIVEFGVDDLQLTMSGAGMTGTIDSVTPVSSSVYDVTVVGAGGDGTIRLDRRANSTVWDLANNRAGSGTYTGGQSYSMRLPGSSTWINSLSDGSWSDSGNWQDGVVANGAGATAEFANLELVENLAVHLDAPRTMGRVIFGDADIATPAIWTLDDSGNPANVLTLASIGTPTVQVNYSGATGDSAATIAAASAAVPAVFDVSISGTQGLSKAGGGTALFTRAVHVTGDLALTTSGGYFRLGNGSSYSPDNVTLGTSAQLQVDGGELTVPGAITIANGGQSGLQVYGGTADVNLITTTGDRDGLVRTTGGVTNIGEIRLLRSSNSESEAASFSRGGLLVQGGVVNIGTLTIPSGNSWSALSIEDGELTVSGAATLANQVTSGRGVVARITGGRFNVAHAGGLVLSMKNGANANNIVKIAFSGGVSTLSGLVLGFDNTVTAGSAAVTIDGGTVYLGASGIVKNGTPGMVTSIVLQSGMVGAAADWSTNEPMTLPLDRAIRFRAASEGGEPHTITLGGVLSGEGAMIKEGGGTLLMTAANVYSGLTTVASGTLDLDGSLAADVLVQTGARIGGSGSVGGSVTLDPESSVVADPLATSPLSIGGLLHSGGSGTRTVLLSAGGGLVPGASYPLLDFASTDMSDDDFVLAPTDGYLGVLQVDPTALRFLVTGVGPTAEFTHWAYLEGLPPGMDGPEDNPAGDGIPNLLKFVLALDPNASTPEGIGSTTVEEEGVTYPAIAFVRRKELGGVTADVLVSTDLEFAALLGSVEVSASDNGDGTETVVVRSAVSTQAQPRQFFRIAATLPATE